MPGVRVGLVLALLLLATTGCEHVSRSAYRKLAVYDPARLQSLDILSMRLALRHDQRVRLDLASSYLLFTGGYEGGLHELCRFVPLVLAEATLVPALPPAGKGMSWTLLGVREQDAPLARVVSRLYWTLIGLQSQKDGGAERLARDTDLLLSELGTIFPRLALGRQVHFNSQLPDFHYQHDYSFRFSDSPAVSRGRIPLEVWVLLDPKDGYLQLVKGPISLEKESAGVR